MNNVHWTFVDDSHRILANASPRGSNRKDVIFLFFFWIFSKLNFSIFNGNNSCSNFRNLKPEVINSRSMLFLVKSTSLSERRGYSCHNYSIENLNLRLLHYFWIIRRSFQWKFSMKFSYYYKEIREFLRRVNDFI